MTLTDIANLVLEDLGARAIPSLDSDDFDAQRVKRRIYTTIDEVATLRKWTRLRKTVKLVKASEDEFGSHFLLPNGLVEIIETFPHCDYRPEGKELIASFPELAIKCTIISYNPNDWCVNLRGAIISKLGADLAMMITKDPQLAMQRKQLANLDIPRYIGNDIYADEEYRVKYKPMWHDGY